MKEFDHEEDFHSKDRKEWRKERKKRSATDRSQYKKTDKVKQIQDPVPDLPRGRVIAITKEGIWVDAYGKQFLATLKGLLKKEKKESKNLIAVGDFVRYTPEKAITYIEARYSFLSRTDISGKKEQLIAVNIDQAVIAVSVVNPPLKPALVDRYLIAAQKGNIRPIIVVNKIDLLQDTNKDTEALYRDFLACYEKLGLPILSISAQKIIGLEALRALLKDKASVFSGQSGVGKSSLLNACFGLDLKTGGLAHKTAKGTHTTTMAELLPLPTGGYCVDTPGIRSFGLWKLTKDDVTAHFQDLAQYSCKFPDCAHINEPECGTLAALKEGKISPLRYESYRTLLDEATGGMDNRAKKKGGNESD